MGNFILGLFWKIVGFFQNKAPPPSRVEVQTDRAAVAETKLTQSTQTASVQSAIAQAEASAPKDRDGVVAELEKGTF